MKRGIYNVGDRVLVRDDLEGGKMYGGLTYFEPDGNALLGKAVTIKKEFGTEPMESAESPAYMFEECKGGYYWSEEMIAGKIVEPEQLEGEPRYKIGETVVVRDDIDDEFSGKSLIVRDYNVVSFGTLYNFEGGYKTLEGFLGNNIEGKLIEPSTSKDKVRTSYGALGCEEQNVEPKYKYNVGDKVLIKDNLEFGKRYSMASGHISDMYMGEMKEKVGKIVEITGITRGKYKIEGSTFYWVDGMIECKEGEILKKAGQEFYDIADNIAYMLVKKNNDYGDSYGKTRKEYGSVSFLARLADKTERYKTLIDGEKQMVDDESIQDTLKDIIGYAILELNYLQTKE